MKVSRTVCVAWLLLLLGLVPVLVHAQAPEPKPEPATPSVAETDAVPDEPETLSADMIRTRLSEVEASSTLKKEEKKQLTELLNASLLRLKAAEKHAATRQNFEQLLATGPEQINRVKQEIAQLRDAPPQAALVDVENKEIDALQQMLVQAQAEATSLDTRLADIRSQLDRRVERANAARSRIDAIEERQDALANELLAAPPSSKDSVSKTAVGWSLLSEQRELAAERKMLEQRFLSEPVRMDLLTVQAELTKLKAEHVRNSIGVLTKTIEQLRRKQASQAVEVAESLQNVVSGQHPLVQEAAAENVALSRELRELAEDLARSRQLMQRLTQQIELLENKSNTTRQKLEVAGATEAIGRVLLQQRRSLADAREIQTSYQKRQQKIAEVGLKQIIRAEELSQLADLDGTIRNMVSQTQVVDRNSVAESLKPLLQDRIGMLKQLLDQEAEYELLLSEVQFEQLELMELTEDFKAFLNEKLVWVRSSPPLTLTSVGLLESQIRERFSWALWKPVGQALVNTWWRSPMPIVALLLAGLLLRLRRRIKSQLEACHQPVGKVNRDHFGYTLRAFGLIFLLALPVPLVLAAVGMSLVGRIGEGDLVRIAGEGLALTALYLLVIQFVYGMTRENGVAVLHLKWNRQGCRRLRRALVWLGLMFVPLVFLGLVIATDGSRLLGGELGRFMIVVIQLVLAAFMFVVLWPRTGAVAPWYQQSSSNLLSRLAYVWFALGAGTPLLLCFLACAGFVYTSMVLTGQYIFTIGLVLLLLMLHALATRWLRINQIKIAYEAAIRKRELALASESEKQSDGLAGELEQIQHQAEDIDVGALAQDSLRLLRTGMFVLGVVGLWLIWSDLIPALNVLDEVELWHREDIVDGKAIRQATSVADIVVGILIAMATFAFAKRLPAILEIVLLRRIGLTSGGRYTITTLTSYIVTAVGVFLVFSTLGFSWSKVQWLVAALTVGIGFGLQEIVANFISGIIILFERPIRVGDIITIGDTSGIVSKIRIRATTIRGWDQKELLVPNREFITGRLLNWTLSDQMTRIEIPVGIAYGSDVAEALRLLRVSCDECERVLAEPEPIITFDTFGDNALNLTVRAYLDSLDYRLTTISELNQKINQKLNDAGIVIAFPQRDVHLDTSSPLDIRLTDLRNMDDAHASD